MVNAQTSTFDFLRRLEVGDLRRPRCRRTDFYGRNMANMCAFVTVFVLHFCLQDQTGSLFEKIVRPFGASEMKQQHTISEEDAEAMQLLLRNGDCGLMNVYFDSLQALGLTGVCFSREDGIFRRQDNRPVTSHCSEHQMKALKAKTVDLDLNNLFLDQTRILNAEN